ncbi:sensor histidine kinase [Novosphingobium humi]|uniref:histidine kinase n=1 Tax=Novosphingobium humi TaxID=2282397 RepID=A0ABY7TUM6_9SPHN|nr:HAMP domain-containing sensor histidine kinase [Novosphingobium humi]WCT76718.1 HAMP domain-containing sensor histidine kinase [Novosphingobium humi]WJS99765.1 HAMP domain-containing histidine kinase [Novosphingobium humi]
MSWLRASAARRIALIGFCAYAVAMLLVAGAVFLATHAAFSRQINLSVEHASAALMAEYRDDGLAGLSRAVAMQRSPGPISLGTAVFAADGRHLAGNLATAAPAPGWHRITFLDPLEGPDTARAKVTLLPGGERLVVAADLEDLQAIDRAILGIFAVAMLALLGIGVGGALVLARYLRGKLAVIEDTASAIVAGDFARRAPMGHNGDEFDRVAASLNAMLDQITSLIANLRQVSADLAHDLRTPLTGLRNHLERMAANGGEQVAMALARTDEVLELFEAILRISEVEEGSLRRAFTRLDLSGLLGELSETLGLLAEDAGKRLETRWHPGLMVLGDRQLLAQVLINLAENAMRHTPPGAAIEVSVLDHADGVALQVRDNGPGIPEADRARVLRRFVRLESSRSTPGHGLGLSLVAAIADAHGAALTLGDAGPGLIVTLTFPRKSAS